jgi:selenide,water dikinase
VPHVDDARVLIDAALRDDAAVYQLSEDRAIVVSADFFPPIVDDPRAFGAIAAANALSDLYAMGATPLFALNIVAWPRDAAMLALLGETLDGARETASAAGAYVLGGHSIDDREPKFGMVVVGEVHPDEVVSNSGALPGDVLVLTKPLGTGVLSTALKRDEIGESDMQTAVEIMSTLNAGAARAMRTMLGAIHAATDVTGFGLIGHLKNMLEASDQSARISVGSVPILIGARDLVARGCVPAGTTRNRDAVTDVVSWNRGVSDGDRMLLCDAQTSGGLLMAVAPTSASRLISALEAENSPAAARIGEVVGKRDRMIEVVE